MSYSSNYVGGTSGGGYRLCVTLMPGNDEWCNNYVGTSGSSPTFTKACPAFGTNAVEVTATVSDLSNGNVLDSNTAQASCTQPSWVTPPLVDPMWQETGPLCRAS